MGRCSKQRSHRGRTSSIVRYSRHCRYFVAHNAKVWMKFDSVPTGHSERRNRALECLLFVAEERRRKCFHEVESSGESPPPGLDILACQNLIRPSNHWKYQAEIELNWTSRKEEENNEINRWCVFGVLNQEWVIKQWIVWQDDFAALSSIWVSCDGDREWGQRGRLTWISKSVSQKACHQSLPILSYGGDQIDFPNLSGVPQNFTDSSNKFSDPPAQFLRQTIEKIKLRTRTNVKCIEENKRLQQANQ